MLSSSSRETHGMLFAAQLCGMQPDWLSRRVTLLEQRVDRLETRFDELTVHMNARFAQVDARFDAVDARFDAVDARFDSVEQVLISLQTQITSNHREFRERFDELGRHMRVLHEELIDRIATING